MEDAKHDSTRINSLCGSLLGGAWGTEFYFGYGHPHSDLTCEDFRTRDLFWNQCMYLLDFFEINNIDVSKSENYTNLLQKGDFCLETPGEMYIVFLRNGHGSINLENENGEYTAQWFDSRNGGKMQNGNILNLKAGEIAVLGGAPSEPHKDWVLYITMKK